MLLGTIYSTASTTPADAALISALAGAMPADQLADSSSGVLLRSFAIALLIMAPVALWQGWRMRARRRVQQSSAYQQASDLSGIGTTESGQTLEAVVSRINTLASTLEASERTELDIPANLTVGGKPADPTLVEAVVRDAMDRSGLELIDTTSDGEAVRLVCLRR